MESKYAPVIMLAFANTANKIDTIRTESTFNLLFFIKIETKMIVKTSNKKFCIKFPLPPIENSIENDKEQIPSENTNILLSKFVEVAFFITYNMAIKLKGKNTCAVDSIDPFATKNISDPKNAETTLIL